MKPLMVMAVSIDDPLKRLEYMVLTHTRNICLHPELRIIIHDTLTAQDTYFHEIKREWKKQYVLLRDTIAELKSTDVIGTDVRPSWAALFVLGMMTWVTYWFGYDRKESIDEIADAALKLVFNGLDVKKPA